MRKRDKNKLTLRKLDSSRKPLKKKRKRPRKQLPLLKKRDSKQSKQLLKPRDLMSFRKHRRKN